jgi:hypothetical protein
MYPTKPLFFFSVRVTGCPYARVTLNVKSLVPTIVQWKFYSQILFIDQTPIKLGERIKLLRKAVSEIMLTLLLASLVPVFRVSLIEPKASAALPSAYPLVYVYPDNLTVGVNEIFTISVIAYNLTDAYVKDPLKGLAIIPLGNLYGFDAELSWDPTVIHCIDHTVTAPVESYPTPIPPSPYAGILHGFGEPENTTLFTIKNIVNESGNIPYAYNPNVRAWFCYATGTPATPFNGNGTICTMTFQALKKGQSPLQLEYVLLADDVGTAIGYSMNAQVWLNPPRSGTVRTGGLTASFTYWPSIGVANQPVHFSASVTGNDTPVAKYMWDFGDGARANTTTPLTDHTYNGAGVYTGSLSVMDEDGVESYTVTKEVKIAASRDLKVTSILLSQGTIPPNRILTITARVDNLANAPFDFFENCTVAAYYNASSLGASTTWVLVGTNQTSIAKGVGFNPSFTLNSSSLPSIGTYYYFQVNVTGIPEGYESNITNNVKISDALLYVEIHEPVITTFTFGYERVGELKLPVIEGEDTTFRIIVKNNGNEVDRFNVTLYANSSAIKTGQTSGLQPGTSKAITWKYKLDFGHYNLTVEARVDSFADFKEGWLHVIKPPKLIVEYTPELPIVNQTVTFNASKSIHQDPEGTITLYTWKIYAPDVDPEVGAPTKTLSGHDLTIININFTEVGNWTVILEVADNYDLTYDAPRSATASYKSEIETPVIAVIAEFPSSMILLLLMLLTTLTFILKRKELEKLEH